MSSHAKTPVERKHREVAAFALRGLGRASGAPLMDWIQTGEGFPGSTSGRVELNAFAQALASTESTAYARGLAEGAERERAAVVAYMRSAGHYARTAGDIESGKHLEKSE